MFGAWKHNDAEGGYGGVTAFKAVD